jgi:hypothetical protein
MVRISRKIRLITIIFTGLILFPLIIFTIPVHAAGNETESSMVVAVPSPPGKDEEMKDRSVDPGEGYTSSLPSPSSNVNYPFSNPAGCAPADVQVLSPEEMLAEVQAALSGEFNLAERRQTYIWNGELGSMVDVTTERFAYEFIFNSFAPPMTYLGDHVATVFLANGFVIWFRKYGGAFRLLAIPMTPGVYESSWAGYLKAYWQTGGIPNDAFIFPVMKKLPCQWVIKQGYTWVESVASMFNLDWRVPDYMAVGRKYIAMDCHEANRVSREEIGYWDASSMCGPLTWTILRNANSFPYRIGAWTAGSVSFTSANPHLNGEPWGSFDPDTYSLTQVKMPMPGYDFSTRGNLNPGDIVYSFATPYVEAGYFDHIFLVAGITNDGTREGVSNMVQNYPFADCSINQIDLYTPGDRINGVINKEWNGFGFGRTGTTGFDIFRWNWITYHLNGQATDYTIRWGDTIETIGFDWKISPERIIAANEIGTNPQLIPGQVLHLPDPGIGVPTRLNKSD